MQILTNKILNVISENVENENLYNNNLGDEIIISFRASNEKLKGKELKDMLKKKDISFIRGIVEVKTLISCDFGFPLWKVYLKENNVSCKRYLETIENLEKNNFSFIVSDKYNLDIFYSY